MCVKIKVLKTLKHQHEESLMNIVQQAAEKISQEMLEQFVGIQNHDVNFSELVANIQSCVHEIGVSMIETLIIEADSALRQSPTRKREWHIQRNEDSKSCATTLVQLRLSVRILNIRRMATFLTCWTSI